MTGFQPGLFESGASAWFDSGFARIERVELDSTAWVELQPGWVSGSDALFEQLRAERPWKQRKRQVYGKVVLEPRLTAPWRAGLGDLPPVIEQMRRALSTRCRVEFDSVGFNLYRDGDDAVAWHRDQIGPEVIDPLVVLVSLGEPRKLMLRPFGGGKSRGFPLGRGDLLVTGGTSQRTWEHAVLRVAHAGPRISLAFRHGQDPYEEP